MGLTEREEFGGTGYDFSKPLAPQVDREMARLLWAGLGYEHDDERVERIAQDAREIIDEGFPAVFAFPEAYYSEIAIYGDPKATPFEIIGLLPCA